MVLLIWLTNPCGPAEVYVVWCDPAKKIVVRQPGGFLREGLVFFKKKGWCPPPELGPELGRTRRKKFSAPSAREVKIFSGMTQIQVPTAKIGGFQPN